MGVYYCLSKVEYNGILIAFVGSVITWTISIPFIISSFEKFRYQKYFHLTYMIIEIFLVIAAGVRFTQYSCYTSVFRTLGMKTTDPLNNMKYQYIKEGLPNWVELYTFTFIGTIFLCIWLYCIRTSYNLYRRINIIRMYEDNKLGNNKIVSQKETPNFQNIMGNNNNSQNIFPISAPIYNPQITPYITNQQFPKT
ncbi:Hypothetical protein SRAE_2000156100 [Strongyloides ratti]|uniref:Uncharacterized protein n=1 Tax=Strongyloides ratti TaxID=34506 RepID=A0A090LHC9_STRRB|nr:Hypothetical protein SRAE_2000156100 [Strongyloides ratti]CEF66895.1 Hypothetical protein SRAE_2000156100 [Strongyloides ratti]